MSDQIFFVDLENIQGFDLAKVPPNTRIKIFVGQSQSEHSTDLVPQVSTPRSRLESVRIQ